MVKDLDSRKPSEVDLVSINVMHVARWDILLVTKYVQLFAKFSGPCQFHRAVLARFRDDCGIIREGDGSGGKEENEAFEALKNRLAEASMIAFHDKLRLLTRLASVTGIPLA